MDYLSFSIITRGEATQEGNETAIGRWAFWHTLLHFTNTILEKQT